MCGLVGVIAGEYGPGGEMTDPVGAALEVLAPRGPDGPGRGRARLGDRTLFLGVRRLALVDPARGQQPIVRPGGSTLAWNGEVYNREELRRDLQARGEAFATENDGEVLAALLDREGVEGLRRVEGSYALAWVRAPEGPLVLARDPSGVRPLAWARAGTSFAFASTVEALLATGIVEPRPELEALAGVLRDGVVSGGTSAVRGIRRVLPGEVLEVAPDLTVASRRLPAAPSGDAPPLAVLDALREAVADRVRLDRPWGVFLSGGVDSAVVAALARELGPVRAYTLAFPGYEAADEARRAQRTARRLGLEHVVVSCPRDPTSWVLGAARSFDEPFADASAVPTWGLALHAGRHVRAALTGTGGDEVFGGYRRYWLLGAGPWLRFVPAPLRTILRAWISRSSPDGARLLGASTDPEGLYRGLLRLQPLAETRDLLGPLLARTADPAPATSPRTAGEAMADDLARYLPDDLLVKEDRALMAHGVEGRHPFLDRRVRRAAAALEIRGTPGRAHQKQVLRAFVREVVDPDLARVAKRGFAFPVDALYRGPLRPLAEDLLGSRRTMQRGFLEPVAARRLLRDHVTGARSSGAVLHAMVMLELWARRVLDRDPSYQV